MHVLGVVFVHPFLIRKVIDQNARITSPEEIRDFIDRLQQATRWKEMHIALPLVGGEVIAGKINMIGHGLPGEPDSTTFYY